MAEYEGDERRQPNAELAKLTAEAGAKLSAMADIKDEVTYTRRAVGQLAEALTILDTEIAKAPSREDLAEARRLVTRQLSITGAMLAGVLVLILVANWFFVQGLNEHADQGHNQIVCIHLTPEQRAIIGVQCP